MVQSQRLNVGRSSSCVLSSNSLIFVCIARKTLDVTKGVGINATQVKLDTRQRVLEDLEGLGLTADDL